LIAALLAIVSLVALYNRMLFAIVLVRVLNVWGTGDLLFAFYQGLVGAQLDPRMLGAAFYIPTDMVPPYLITHVMIFRLLVRARTLRAI